MAEIKGVGNSKPSRKPKGVHNGERPNGKAWKKHPKSNDVSTFEQKLRREEKLISGADYKSV